MSALRHLLTIGLLALVIATSCAPPAPGARDASRPNDRPETQGPARTKRIADRLYVTIPRPERMEVLRQIMRYVSENLNVMGLFYDGDFVFSNNRLQNIAGNESEIWTVPEWDIRN